MSSWTALNVEPEDASEDEIDDTKEIQLEEAFKLYQTALKFHSQGPEYYAAAQDAYNELFRSEVFKYPEAVSEFDQDNLDAITPQIEVLTEPGGLPLLAPTGTDTAANSLPQLIYLSYKSRAQFSIDVARHERHSPVVDRIDLRQYYRSVSLKSLEDSAGALARDDTDLDLWKKAARISDVLATQRIARFCLESVLAGDDDGAQTIDISGLDEAFAKGELENVLDLLEDDLSLLRQGDIAPKSSLINLLRLSNDPYPFLPHSTKTSEYLYNEPKPVQPRTPTLEIVLTANTQVALGRCLLQAYESVNKEMSLNSGTTIKIILPGLENHRDAERTNTTDISLLTSSRDIMNTEDFPDRGSNTIALDSPGSFHSAPDRIATDTGSPAPAQPVAEEIDEDKAMQDTVVDESSGKPQGEIALPTRKRSSTVAGIEEPESRARSKRIRARESLLEQTIQDDDHTQDVTLLYREQLANIESADESTFKAVNSLLMKVGVLEIGPSDNLREEFCSPGAASGLADAESYSQQSERLLQDLRHSLQSWNDEQSSAIISGHGARDFVEKSTGLSLFLKHSKVAMPRESQPTASDNVNDVSNFVKAINTSTTSIYDAITIWLWNILTHNPEEEGQSSYAGETWSDSMRQLVFHLMTTVDEYIMSFLHDRISASNSYEVDDRANSPAAILPQSLIQIVEFAQSLFEIHLDIYAEMTAPGSDADQNIRTRQLFRVDRWLSLATDTVQLWTASIKQAEKPHQLLMRFIWASATFVKNVDQANKEHVLLCLHDLKHLFSEMDTPIITLPNSVIMPQISTAAVEQEISRLTTLDFFMSVFDTDNSDPVSVIMKLEPILEPDSTVQEIIDSTEDSDPATSDQIQKFRAFLEAGDASLTLFLWRRLQNAYTAISYTPKVVSCLLRSIEKVVNELHSERHYYEEAEKRRTSMLRWLRDGDELVAKVLAKSADDPKAFESIDEKHLVSSLTAVTSLLKLVHGFALFDDSIRVGQTPAPQLRSASSLKQFEKAKDRLREMYVRLWTLLYVLLKEAVTQMPEHLDNHTDDLTLYLRCVHKSLGERQYCKHCNKLFVRMAKTELLAANTEQDYSVDLAQILYDLYQIKLSAGLGDHYHGCPPESLDKDKRTAHTLIPIIMSYARRYNIRDLIKSELKGAIEKVQGALGQNKASPQISHNKRTITAYLKSPINPKNLYEAVRGIGDLTTKEVHGDFATVASSGWYLLLGNMTLARYKSVKRVNPTPTDDLDTAATFLRQDLEYNTGSWETWYRLAQVFDAKIEDSLIWNSTKLNDSRGEIATLERNAINAYTMATAVAMRSADDGEDTVKLIGCMFFDFAVRLYSSSRPPLDMEAFNTEKSVRHLSSSHDQTMSKQPLFKAMSPYSVWNFAAHLLRRCFSEKRDKWLCHYTLGKCLWKMFKSQENSMARHPVTSQQIVEVLQEAVETVPKKEKSSDPILEPHFKLVSVVHKSVEIKKLMPQQGVEILQTTPYAKGVHLGDDEDWETYILSILRKLQTADKSNWHHRIIDRAAHTIYDNEPEAGALGAKQVFTQQIFTKTMTMQVWKPEFERAGRHYVYTGRYLRFFVHLLDRLRDRTNLEQVVRRIRRKTTDFLDHTKIWEETVLTYVGLLRRIGQVPEGRERALFDNISFEEFSRRSEKLEQWAHDPDNTSSYLDIMQDAIELKKLNNSLMKGLAIDDLIGDTYACMYEAFVSQLPAEEQVQSQNTLPQGTFINMTTETAPTGDDSLDRMRLNNLLSSQTDGLTSEAPLSISLTGLGIQTPIGRFIGTPPPADAIRLPAPAKPGRAKTITRREVQRKAEAALVKPPPIKTPTLSKRLIINIPGVKRTESDEKVADDEEGVAMQNAPQDEEDEQSRANSRQVSVSARPSADPDDGDAEDEAEPDGEDEGENDGEADDESGLSDLDEQVQEDLERQRMPIQSLFPGLMGRKRKAEDGDTTGHQDDADGDGTEAESDANEIEIQESQEPNAGEDAADASEEDQR